MDLKTKLCFVQELSNFPSTVELAVYMHVIMLRTSLIKILLMFQVLMAAKKINK